MPAETESLLSSSASSSSAAVAPLLVLGAGATRAGLKEATERNAATRRVWKVQEVIDIPYEEGLDASRERHPRRKLDLYIPTTTSFSPDPPISGSSASASAVPQPTSPPASALPSSASGKRPVIVFIHGGGWKKMDRRGMLGLHANVGRALAREGYVVAVPSYRLSQVPFRDMVRVWGSISLLAGGVLLAAAVAASALPLSPSRMASILFGPFALSFLVQPLQWWRSLFHKGARHPDHCDDAAMAVSWVLRNIEAYSGDATRVAVAGHSAGGHIASMLAVQPERLVRAGCGKDVREVASRIRAFGLLSGVYSARLLEDMDSIATQGKWWRWPSVLFRRTMFLFPAFGDDESAWEGGFIEGVLRKRVEGTKSEGEASPEWRPPLLLLNVDNDWGLDAHAEAVAPLLAAAGYADVTRVRILGSEHVGYVLGMGAKGTVGQELAIPTLADWVATRM